MISCCGWKEILCVALTIALPMILLELWMCVALAINKLFAAR